MAFPAEKTDRPFTYGDYLTWPDDERWEIIDGIPMSMGPATMRRQQKILGNLYSLFRAALKEQAGHTCELYLSPFDVRLPEKDEADQDLHTVVQPDLVLVCDPSKLDDRGCRGAPDLVVEILSPSSAVRDMQIKRDLYERHGVREYWIVQPGENLAVVYTLQDGLFDRGAVFRESDTPSLRILPDVKVSLAEVFAE